MTETGRETAGDSPAALQAANERRTIEAAGRNRKLAAAALLRLGGDCPPQLEEVGTEVILHSQYPWSEIGRRLGLTRQQAISRFRRLLAAAGVQGHVGDESALPTLARGRPAVKEPGGRPGVKEPGGRPA